jgi:hypothetical protein
LLQPSLPPLPFPPHHAIDAATSSLRHHHRCSFVTLQLKQIIAHSIPAITINSQAQSLLIKQISFFSAIPINQNCHCSPCSLPCCCRAQS